MVRVGAEHRLRQRDEASELRARPTVVEQALSELGGYEHVRHDDAEIAEPVPQQDESGPPCRAENSQLVNGDAVEVVRDMKRRASRPMRTVGSVSLCRSLLEAGLADRFRVVVFPVITGATGKDRIFDNYPDVALELVGSRTFDGRLQLLEYVPRVLEGPPGFESSADRWHAVGVRGRVRCVTCQRRCRGRTAPHSRARHRVDVPCSSIAPVAGPGFALVGQPELAPERSQIEACHLGIG
jgi:dihydrofolate reductase